MYFVQKGMIHTPSHHTPPSTTHTSKSDLKALAPFTEDIFNSALIGEEKSPWYLYSLRNVKQQLPMVLISGRDSSTHPAVSYCWLNRKSGGSSFHSEQILRNCFPVWPWQECFFFSPFQTDISDDAAGKVKVRDFKWDGREVAPCHSGIALAVNLTTFKTQILQEFEWSPEWLSGQ